MPNLKLVQFIGKGCEVQRAPSEEFWKIGRKRTHFESFAVAFEVAALEIG